VRSEKKRRKKALRKRLTDGPGEGEGEGQGRQEMMEELLRLNEELLGTPRGDRAMLKQHIDSFEERIRDFGKDCSVDRSLDLDTTDETMSICSEALAPSLALTSHSFSSV
jgi:hypothetical protein